MKSSVRVCLQRKCRVWKESNKLRESSIVVYSRWNLELEVSQVQFPGMEIKDSKPALLYELLKFIFNVSKCNRVKLIK